MLIKKEIVYSMMKAKYKTIDDMFKELISFEKETKLKLHHDSSNFYDDLNYLRPSGKSYFEEDLFSKSTQGIAMIMHEALLIFKFFQTTIFKKYLKDYDLYCNIIIRKGDICNFMNHIASFAKF